MGEKYDEFDEDTGSIMVLNDENGNEVEYEFLDRIEFEGEEYIVLFPIPEVDTGEIDTVTILKVIDSDDIGKESYGGVGDNDTLEAVFEIFKERFSRGQS